MQDRRALRDGQDVAEALGTHVDESCAAYELLASVRIETIREQYRAARAAASHCGEHGHRVFTVRRGHTELANDQSIGETALLDEGEQSRPELGVAQRGRRRDEHVAGRRSLAAAIAGALGKAADRRARREYLPNDAIVDQYLSACRHSFVVDAVAPE